MGVTAKVHIAFRVPAEVKAQVRELAAREGATESALLKNLLGSVLREPVQSAKPPPPTVSVPKGRVVLHTDEPHPHVHLVVKALGEDGRRLNIRKETLRTWRREFARHLREEGVVANATDRASRGNSRGHKTDGIFRAHVRGASTITNVRVSRSRGSWPKDHFVPNPGRRPSWGPDARCFADGQRLRARSIRSASLNWPLRSVGLHGHCRHRSPISNR